MINHPQKGIFTPVRNEPLTGRNANIQPTMFKRKQIFQKALQQRTEPPFSGYSFTGSSVTDNNSLARSQVSQISQQSFARLFREQMQKNGMNTMSETSQESLKYKNDLNIMRIQIRGIKQSYHEFNKAFKKKLEDQNQTINELRKQISNQSKENSIVRDDVSAQLVQKIQEVEQGIAVKMRLIFTKMQEDLRKELTNYANREFVPTSFLDDLDKQLNDLDDRIANMETEYEASKSKGNKQNLTVSKIDRDSSMIMSSGSELKLKQFERDLANLKKELDQKSQIIRQIDQSTLMKHEVYSKELKQVKQVVAELSLSAKDRQKQYDSYKKNLQVKMENDKKKLFEKIESDFDALTKKIDQDGVFKSLALSNSAEPESFKKKTESTSIIVDQNQSKFEETMDESKMSAISESNHHQKSQIITNDETDQRTFSNQDNDKNVSPIGIQTAPIVSQTGLLSKDSPKKTKKITITYGASDKLIGQTAEVEPQVLSAVPQTLKSPQVQKSAKQEQEIKTLYKVDKEGYLMDMNNKYLLSASNSMIYVSEKQIEAMESTSLLKVEKWVSS